MTRTDWNALDPDHWLVAWTGSKTEFKDVLDRIGAVPEGTAARLLRAERMRDETGLHQECASRLQFPTYYGRVGTPSQTASKTSTGSRSAASWSASRTPASSWAPHRMLTWRCWVTSLPARENWRHPVYERDLRDEPQPFTVVLQDTEAGLRSLASRAPAFHGLLEQLP